MIQHFSTDRVKPGRRLDYWNACATATFPRMTIDSPSAAFRAEMTRWRIGDLVMARPCSIGSLVRRGVDDCGGERIIVHMPRRGIAEQVQRDRTSQLRPGDVSVCTTGAPLRLQTADHEMLVVQARRGPLDERVPNLDDRMAGLVSGATPAARMLHDFVLSLWRQGPTAAGDPAWENGVTDVLYDLLALALRGTEIFSEGPSDDIARMQALVEARLGDPELKGASLAEELGVSLRWVQHLFAGLSTTPSGYILGRRLARAAERLESHPGLSITDLAFDLGFNDSAYFARCFRRQFGVSPTAWAKGRAASR